MSELEQEVLDIIEETTCAKYIGKLKVIISNDVRQCGDPNCRPLGGTIYELRLYLDRWFTPIILSYEGNEEEFKDFLRQEFKSRKLERVGFYKLILEPSTLDDEELTDWDNE